MQVIDFRARPNTPEFMALYRERKWDEVWNRFQSQKPTADSLESFVAEMDNCKVDRVVFPGRQSTDKGSVTWGIPNDYVAECANSYPARIIGIAGIDPTDTVFSVRECHRAVTELGLQGISIDPDLGGFAVNSPVAYPVYSAAAELGVPVIITMGPLVGSLALPRMVDEVAEHFPDLRIVCSHGCWPETTEYLSLAYRRRNVYLEVSIYFRLPGADLVFEAANGPLHNKIIYASAFPFRPLGELDEFRHQLSASVQEDVLFGNAQRLLGTMTSSTNKPPIHAE